MVVTWIPYKTSFEEGDVKDGGVKVDELEDEDLEREVVLKLCLCAVHL